LVYASGAKQSHLERGKVDLCSRPRAEKSPQGGEKEQSTCVACPEPKNNTTIKLCGASRKTNNRMMACGQQVSASKKTKQQSKGES